MTQQYTPVAWQDETTSQQGTLINAERLNQMQTAHHYADGFEEVDAVPTANPGVQYHKIVYCTADNTFYRWDGTEWTKDIDDETKALLQQEIARATEAEGELAQDLADETTARETADSAMQADITAMQSAKLDKKTTGPLQYQIYGVRGSNQIMFDTWGTGHSKVPTYGIEEDLLAKMPTYGLTDDTVVNYGWATAQIGAEATARAEADTALGGRIDTEQARAEAAEQVNAQAIANTYTKAEADALLALKADQATTYTKTETDTLLASKADKATTYTKAEVDTYLAAKLDTLSTTGLHAYTHNGATQSEVAVIDGTTASTIPIRDTNGRLQAADPASGATDKSLVTANWVSQSGDTSPNNLLHKNGNETKTGNLLLMGVTGIMGMYNNKASENIEGTSTWRRLYYNTLTPANQMLLLVITPQKPAISTGEYGILMIGGTANNPPVCKWIVKGEGIVLTNFVMVYSETAGFELWVKNENANRGICATRLTETNWGSITNNWSVDTTTSDASFDYTTYPFYKVSE